MFRLKYPVEQTNPPLSPRETLPTMYDLPSEDSEEPGLPDEFHDLQPQLLSFTFSPPSYPPEQVFSASDLNLYYDVRHQNWYKRPDWFGVVGVPRLYDQQDLRLSYVIWQEGISPFVVVELLSPGTEKEDLGQTTREANQPPTKWEVYEQILRVPYYVVFNRYTDQLRAFTQVSGRYQELDLTEPRIWIPTLELGLGLWQGEYQGSNRQWLRWYDAQGNWIPTEAEIERQRAQQAEQRAQQAEQRAEELAQRLRDLGIEL
ncbi:Uma2 family endonuclease [Trichocoleus sp. DQ-A3]|uniref:Uma2 family endonuclease n=1 Tax=Cyanophyceae TaxID=3028117 RepID=UPI001685E9EC|nr:Uma2 family endonuclease [Coleofasciculus sp. FACHB-125]MBD1899657.1 Uma2 family endonuclease [Coleofasciculus sp. FACHB-125]